MKGKRVCRMHGGTGGAPKGNSNARKHGAFSVEYQLKLASLQMMFNLCFYQLSGGKRHGRGNRFMRAIAELPPDEVMPTLRALIAQQIETPVPDVFGRILCGKQNNRG